MPNSRPHRLVKALRVLTLSSLLCLFSCVTSGSVRPKAPVAKVTKATSPSAPQAPVQIIEDGSVITVQKISLGMSYAEVLSIWGPPSAAWYQPRPQDGYVRLFSDVELMQLREKGLEAFPTVGVIRFGREPDLKSRPIESGDESRPVVQFGSDGKVVYVEAGSLEADGRKIGSRESGSSQLADLKLALGKPDAVRQVISGEELFYRHFNLEIETRKGLDLLIFSLHKDLEAAGKEDAAKP